MRRAIDLAIKAVVAFVFVVCVECFCLRLRRKARGERPAPLPPARLRMRTDTGRAQATIAIEGTLDEFTARLLACSVAQFPGAAAIVLDLSSAGPIRGKALAVVARVFAAGASGAGARVWRRPRGIARALLQGGAVAARAGAQPRRPPSPSSVEQAVPRGGYANAAA